jgi:uncharacterized protein YqjF (DUF2071 family)
MDHLPPTHWFMTQTWEHLLFMHWAVEPLKIKTLIPAELELDTYEGMAWITVVPFKVTHQRFYRLPEIPLLNHYLELNVRTYVKFRGIQGVFFFTLDANHPLAVLGAKALSLPYRNAKMSMEQQNKVIVFKSNRVFGRAGFSALYEPVSTSLPTIRGSLDYWLLERYCLFTKWGNFIFRGDIRHESWEVSEAKVRLAENTVTPLDLTNQPSLFHYSLKKEAFILPFKKV